MHRTPVIAGSFAFLVAAVFVLTVALGLGVDLAQSLGQSLPILLAIGVAVALGSEVLRRELA